MAGDVELGFGVLLDEGVNLLGHCLFHALPGLVKSGVDSAAFTMRIRTRLGKLEVVEPVGEALGAAERKDNLVVGGPVRDIRLGVCLFVDGGGSYWSEHHFRGRSRSWGPHQMGNRHPPREV